MRAVNQTSYNSLVTFVTDLHVKVKVVDLYSASTRSISKALSYSTHCQEITQFYLHTQRFIRKRSELYLPLPSQPQLVLIYRPRRDGRLSRFGAHCDTDTVNISPIPTGCNPIPMKFIPIPIKSAVLYISADNSTVYRRH